MSDITSSPSVGPSRMILPQRLTSLGRLWRAVRRRHRQQVTAATLHRLSDHVLRDIGLERDSIDAVVCSGGYRR